MGGRAEGTGVRRIIKTASEECASTYPREKLAVVSDRNMPIEIVDNRTSITVQGIEEPRPLPLLVHIRVQCCSALIPGCF